MFTTLEQLTNAVRWSEQQREREAEMAKRREARRGMRGQRYRLLSGRDSAAVDYRLAKWDWTHARVAA